MFVLSFLGRCLDDSGLILISVGYWRIYYLIVNCFLMQDAFAAERRKAKMLNFSIAYGKTPVGLSRDWKVAP